MFRLSAHVFYVAAADFPLSSLDFFLFQSAHCTIVASIDEHTSSRTPWSARIPVRKTPLFEADCSHNAKGRALIPLLVVTVFVTSGNEIPYVAAQALCAVPSGPNL